MAQRPWTPRLTRGLWAVIQRAVREGIPFHEVGAAARAAGERPDAATIAHLYSRARAAEAIRSREADYRGRVDRETYLARRPSGQLVALLPRGWSTARRWTHVLEVTVRDLAGRISTLTTTVQSDRLLSRGEAIEAGVEALRGTRPALATDIVEAEYVMTWTTEE